MEHFFKRPDDFKTNISTKSYNTLDFNRRPVHNDYHLSKSESDLITDGLKNRSEKTYTSRRPHINDLYTFDNYNKNKIKSNDNSNITFLRNSYFGFNKPSKFNYEPDNTIKNNIFGNPTDEEIRVRNLQAEEGVPNSLNDKILSYQTGESIENIKEARDYINNERNDEINKILSKLRKVKEDININKHTTPLTKQKQNQIVEIPANKEIEKINNKAKQHHKADIRPIIQHNKSNSLLNIDVDDIVEDDKKNKAVSKIQNLIRNVKAKKEETKEKNEAASKIQNFSKNIKAKKEGKEIIKNIVENINKDTHKKMLNKVFDEVNNKKIKKGEAAHKKMLNKVFDEAKGIEKFNTKTKEKVLNYNQIYPLRNKNKFSKINPLQEQSKPIEVQPEPEPEPKQTEEPQKRTRGRPKKNYTPEELANKLEATRSSDRIRKANKRAADKQSKK